MPLNYLDTSILARRYLPEPASAWARDVVLREPGAISVLTLVEFASVLGRRMQSGEISAQQCESLYALFIQETRQWLIIDIDPEVVDDAAGFLLNPSSVRLRALDAIHLASARKAFGRARDSGAAAGVLLTADRSLFEAARRAGVPVGGPPEAGIAEE